MNKDDVKRPELKGLVLNGTKDVEQFQNEVLRPILKMQHSLLIAFFSNYLTKRKITFSEITPKQQQNYIESALSKDIGYKNFQLGIVTGQLSLEEYSFYKKNSSELNKRILQMLKKRLKESIQEIIK